MDDAADLVEEVEEYEKRFGQTGSPTGPGGEGRDARAPGEIADSPEAAAERVVELLGEVERYPPASSWEKPERLGTKPGEGYDCWTVVELVGGAPRHVSLELLGKGRELAGKLGGLNVALVLGHDLDGAAREAARYGAERVVVVDDERLAEYHPDPYFSALRRVVESERPHALSFIPSTIVGRDYGPRVAGELELAHDPRLRRPRHRQGGAPDPVQARYGGNIISVIMGATTPQLATVRPGMFAPVEPRDDAEAEITRLPAGHPPRHALGLSRSRAPPGHRRYELDSATICLRRQGCRHPRGRARDRGPRAGGSEPRSVGAVT